MTENYSNNYATTLSGAINSSVTALVVASATASPSANFRIIIDSEIMLVTAKGGTTFTVTRAQEGTTAASHSNGATVTHVLTAASYDTGINERVATHTALTDAHHNRDHAINGATHTGTINTANITDAAVTYAKVQDVTAASKLLGRGQGAGAGDVQELTLGTNLSMSGTTLNASGGGGAVASDVIFDAKGDLPAGTGADTAAKLTVGANDSILMADSAQTTGLKWAPRDTTGDIADIAVAEAASTTDAYAGANHTHAHGTGYAPDAHHNQTHTYADHTDQTRELYITTEQFNGDGASIGTIGTNQTAYRAATLADTFDRGVRFGFRLPDDWVSGMSYTLLWSGSTTQTQVVRFQATYLYGSAATVLQGAGTAETAWSSSQGTITADQLVIDTEKTIATGISAGSFLRFNIRRLASSDAADTYTGAVQLIGVVFKYTAHQ